MCSRITRSAASLKRPKSAIGSVRKSGRSRAHCSTARSARSISSYLDIKSLDIKRYCVYSLNGEINYHNRAEERGNVMGKMIFVNLPVRDLKASTAFYTALGGTLNPQFSGEKSSCMMLSDAIVVMLLTHEHYRQFTQRPIGDARRESQALLALSADSRDAVNATLAQVGSRRRPRRSQPGAGSRLHVRPQRRGSGRQRMGDHVDGPGGARPKAA